MIKNWGQKYSAREARWNFLKAPQEGILAEDWISQFSKVLILQTRMSTFYTVFNFERI